jgi:putative copper export protein
MVTECHRRTREGCVVNWLQFVVQWLHVLLAILWFGYALSMYFLVAPALARLPEGTQREANLHLGELGQRVFPIVALLVILLGIIRGTVFGPINSIDALLGTAYGITFLVALLVTIGLIVNGARNIGPTTKGLKEAPDFAAAVARLRRFVQIDLALFLVVFTCMILMRFGL